MAARRRSNELERAGYPIARSTLCSIFHRSAEQLKPIYDELRRVVRKARYVNADETGQRVLDKEHCLKGWMWVILSQQAIAYHYSDSRGSGTAKELLGGTSGNRTIDGYAAYNCLSDNDARQVRAPPIKLAPMLVSTSRDETRTGTSRNQAQSSVLG